MEITFMCERLHCLPNPGGLFQQETSHIKRMQRVMAARDQWRDDSDPARKTESKQRLEQKVAQSG